MLITRFGWSPESIVMLSEDERDPSRRPTRRNMEIWMRWLVSSSKPGDRLFFHYSGHGGTSRDRTGEEVDGMNETLIPLDSKFAGNIVDDEINKIMVNPLPTGVTMHCVIDACHSGTVMDLPFLSKGMDTRGNWIWEDQRRRIFKGTAGGEVICFSGCDDSQTSADTSSLARDGANTGALTFAFINAIEATVAKGRHCTYATVLKSIRGTLGQAAGGGRGRGDAAKSFGFGSMLLGGVLGSVFDGGGGYSGGGGGGGGYTYTSGSRFRSGFSQDTQISCSNPFDVDNRPFKL